MLAIWRLARAASAVVALAIGAVSLRTTGVYFIMITLAFAQMIYYFAVSLPTYGGEAGLSIYLRSALPLIDSEDPLSFFLICSALLLAALFLMHRLVDSPFGPALQCARLNTDRQLRSAPCRA